MRALLLTHVAAPDRVGGLERHVRELAAALVEAGVPTTIVTKRISAALPARERGDDGVELYRVGVPDKASRTYPIRYPLALFRTIVRAMTDRSADTVVHGHYCVPSLTPLVTGRPFVYTFHAPLWRELVVESSGDRQWLHRSVARGVRVAERALVARASHVIVHGRYTRELVQELHEGAAANAIVIPGGIDAKRFPEQSANGHPREEGALRLFTARRMTPRTGLAELIEAIPAVAREFPGVQLDVAGDGALRPQLEARIRELGLDGSVRLLGRVSEEALAAGYRDADLAVMPTQHLEGFGLTTVEALASGTPVVGTPVGANPDILEPLDPALVSKDASPAGIAAAIVRVARDPERLARVRSQARASVLPALDWSVLARRYLEVYEDHLRVATRRPRSVRLRSPTGG